MDLLMTASGLATLEEVSDEALALLTDTAEQFMRGGGSLSLDRECFR